VSKSSSSSTGSAEVCLSMISIQIKKISVRFCAFIFLVFKLYAVDVDAVDACIDGAGVHADADVAIFFGPPTVAPPAKKLLMKWLKKGWIAKPTYFLIP
jgi:hypothetical protein